MTRTALAAALALCPFGASACVEPMTLHEVSASGSAGAGYVVAPGERVVCFDVSVSAPDEVIAVAPRLATEVAHHVALHRATRAPIDGDCSSVGPATLLYMGSPGDDALVAPAGHALALREAPTDVIVLELHYVNPSGTPREDASGLTLTVGGARPRPAIGPWIVGDVSLDIPPRARGHTEGCSCAIRAEGPVTLHAVSPHMHARGVALSVQRERGGVLETLIDVRPFDPLRQRTVTLEEPIELTAGDRIELRCTYDNPTDGTLRYGVHLEDEMCFAYFWASPIEVLRDDAPFCH